MEPLAVRQQVMALRHAAQAIDISQRSTGRTTRELDRVLEGEAVICSVRERYGIERHFKQLRKRVQVMAPTIEEFLRGDYPRGARDYHFTHDFTQDWIEWEINAIGMRIEDRMKSIQRSSMEKYEKIKERVTAPNPLLDELTYTPVDIQYRCP